MKQYCRYCTYSNLVDDDIVYCSIFNVTMKKQNAVCVNHCKEFEFNPMDVFNPDHVYKPRTGTGKNYKQTKLF